MNKACLTRSLSSICLGKQTKQAEIQTTQGTLSTLVRRRNSLTRMHSQATGSHVEPSQTGQIPQGAEALARIPRLREHPLQAPGPHSPLATAPTVTSATPVGGSSAMPHAVLCMTAAAGSRSLPDEMRPGQIKGWVWLAEQIVAAKRHARELKHQYHEADPDADDRDDRACQLKCAQARLQFLTTLEERLRAAARAGEAQTSDDTVWKLNHLSPERMPIEFLELLPSSATVIELAGNRIKVIPDGTFERFRRLERLGLSGNQLGTLSRQSLRGLEGLTELDLSSNAIATIDPDGLAGLGALRKLRLDSNNLRRFPCLPKALEEANLSANAISVISPQHLEGLSRLQSLNLNNNRLERFKPPVAGLKALKVLCLGYNQLTQLDRWLMRLLPNLRTLVLADNSLSEITRESMQGPPAYPSRLSNLSLADNAIRHLEAGAFREMMALQVLDLENNRLSELPDILPRTPALMRVNLSNNMLRRIDNDIFSGLPNLGRIDLSQNQITEIGEQILGQPTGMSHTAVIHIQLQDNALQQFPAGMLRHGWIRVDLYNNRFTQAEAARLEAGPHAAGTLCLSNFSRHEREFTRWLGKPMTSLLAGVRYVTGVDSLYEFLHTVRHIVSHRAALPMALQDKRERILANVLDRVEALLPGLVANQTLAAQCFEALQSGLKGCGDRAMLAWWLLEIECRKQGILLASPDRQQLVQLGIWLHRLEKLLQFAKVLSARSTGNTAEAVEIQLWLLEALHHQVLGDLGRAGDTSMQILYKSAVLVHNRDLLEMPRCAAAPTWPGSRRTGSRSCSSIRCPWIGAS
ncbi:NEL-type E3 ubiquitin ligase domain-containing protein [Imbroritus primus]|uniref:NEL-type E3 ubiquitin ligase domain-containing protein n=1 Tax=Imbroritus primus TaxID=3058603 RepID=UPI003D1617F6